MENVYSSTFSKNFKQLLSDNKMSQIEFANKTGISHSAISQWLSGKRSPSIQMTNRICDFFGCSPSELFSETTLTGEYKIISDEFMSLTNEQRAMIIDLISVYLARNRKQKIRS